MKIKNPFSFDERAKKHGSTEYYLVKMVDYCLAPRANGSAANAAFPPIMAQMFLSLLIDVRAFFSFARFAIAIFLFVQCLK